MRADPPPRQHRADIPDTTESLALPIFTLEGRHLPIDAFPDAELPPTSPTRPSTTS
jgi:hypothetical protein